MAIGESAGILFKIKGDSSDAVRAFKQTEAAQNDLTGTTKGLGGAFSDVLNPVTLVSAGIVAIGTAAIAGTAALFNLTKSTAEFGSEIFDASEKTGLSAESLSAMKFAADQSGTSLEAITLASAKFAKTIDEAARGSEKAQEKLNRLGVTSKDLDTALGQALTTIAKYPPGVQQMTAAQVAFGKSGADLLPFIKSFDGDLPGLIAKCKELGVTINDEAAKAADEFGDTLDTLSAQFAGVGRTIGTQFMPIFQAMATSLSSFLTENQGAIRTFATNSSDFVRGLIITIQELDRVTADSTGSSVASWALWAMEMKRNLDPVVYLYDLLLKKMIAVGGNSRKVSALAGANLVDGEAGGSVFGSDGFDFSTGGGGSRGGGGRASTPKRDDTPERDLAARIRQTANDLRIAQQSLKEEAEKIRDVFEKDGNVDKFIFDSAENMVAFAASIAKTRDELNALEAQAKENATTEEKNLLTQEQLIRKTALDAAQEEEREKNRKKIIEVEKDDLAALIKLTEELGKAEERRLETARKKAEMDAFLAPAVTTPGIDALLPDILSQKPETDTPYNPFQYLIDGWQQFIAQVNADAPTLEQTLSSVGGLFINAFEGMANAIGSVVEQWVLYGETGPAVLKKVLAAALASIAAEAAVRAIYELAMGFASLFLNPAEASGHFIAAALFGTIAVGAALAGRAIAGDSFKKQSGKATGGSGGSDSEKEDERYTSQFSGYGENNPLNQTLNRLNENLERNTMALGVNEETAHTLVTKITSFTPGDVIGRGAEDNPRAIQKGLAKVMQSDGRATTRFHRDSGGYK